MDAVLADRAEHGPGESAVAAAADYEQVGAFRVLDQDLRRVAPVGDAVDFEVTADEFSVDGVVES
ncbi:hypothetical protein ADL26_08250, partial [Thermoactinomyces vulgaris]